MSVRALGAPRGRKEERHHGDREDSGPGRFHAVVRGSAGDALEQLLASGRAVKVLVKRSTRDEDLYVLRRADGQAPALGTREAVIVLLDEATDDGFFATPKAST